MREDIDFRFQELVILGTTESAARVTKNHIPSLADQICEWESDGRLPRRRTRQGSFKIVYWRDLMKNVCVVAMLAAAIAGSTLVSASAEPASKAAIKNVVLVHGAFADGSGWKAVAEILEKEGYAVSVAQPPETSYADDQKYTKAAIDAMGGPVVLVGHSYGGSIITEAGNDANVAALVYIAAFALDDGESCASIEQALPQASKAFKPDSNGNWWIEQAHFAADFAADVPPAESWFMVASADRSINPEQERMMAKRAHATTVEVNSSHVAYMSHPKEAAKLIEEAATAAPASH